MLSSKSREKRPRHLFSAFFFFQAHETKVMAAINTRAHPVDSQLCAYTYQQTPVKEERNFRHRDIQSSLDELYFGFIDDLYVGSGLLLFFSSVPFPFTSSTCCETRLEFGTKRTLFVSSILFCLVSSALTAPR